MVLKRDVELKTYAKIFKADQKKKKKKIKKI
jgi:hypothetical protein